MPRGKNKETNEQKRLRGTDFPYRMTPEVELDCLTVVPKTKLKGTAKQIFNYTATMLICKRLLEMVGVDLLIAYSREMAIYHDCMAEVEKEGLTIEIETKTGTIKTQNIKRKIAESALANAKSLAAEFGFTPISRSRIAGLIDPKAHKDEFSEFEIVK